MNNYAPRPDTVAFKALAHLETLMHGAEVPTGTLAVEAHCEPGSFTQYMQAALKHGVVFARQKGGHPRSPLFWSLVDHSKNPEIPRPAVYTPVSARSEAAPAAQPTGQGDGVATPNDGRPGVRRSEILEAVAAGKRLQADFARSLGVDIDKAHEHFHRATVDEAPLGIKSSIKAVEKAEVHPLPRVRAGTAPARWGIFSDGDLHIEKAGQQIVLDRGEFEAFVAFLDRMAEPQS